VGAEPLMLAREARQVETIHGAHVGLVAPPGLPSSQPLEPPPPVEPVPTREKRSLSWLEDKLLAAVKL
jgi:hypothetical protein